MDKELPVDLLFVVSYLEQLSLEIIITVMQNNKRSLNGLLLPRSWVLRIIRGPERTPCRNPRVSLLFGLIGILMRKIILWNGAGTVCEQERGISSQLICQDPFSSAGKSLH